MAELLTNPATAVSLFTSGGLGDLALVEAKVDVLVSNELCEDRHQVFSANFPGTTTILGDIWQESSRIVETAKRHLAGRPLTILYATPPCQGMSKNGRGKLLNAIRAGTKPPMDERNRLIIPAMRVAVALRPEIVVLENVPEMSDTLMVDDDGRATGIIDFVRRSLGNDYVGGAEVVEFADYGVPQCRQRLITIFSRLPRLTQWFCQHRTLLPPVTHQAVPDRYGQTKPWVTVRDMIEDLPPLDAGAEATARSSIPYHRVPLLDSVKHWWVRQTPPERSAFDNQCATCGYTGNPTHLASRDRSGINRTSHDTPLHCNRCGELLPRPSVDHAGERRLMRGFTSAYKRMSYDRPASALTRNLSYACSDNKLHPTQNRVLSLYEAFRLHTIDRFPYQWRRADGRRLSDKTIREIIGEGIPPAGLLPIIRHLLAIRSHGPTTPAAWSDVGPLFAVRPVESACRRSDD